jgi:hypothetical protein
VSQSDQEFSLNNYSSRVYIKISLATWQSGLILSLHLSKMSVLQLKEDAVIFDELIKIKEASTEYR